MPPSPARCRPRRAGPASPSANFCTGPISRDALLPELRALSASASASSLASPGLRVIAADLSSLADSITSSPALVNDLQPELARVSRLLDSLVSTGALRFPQVRLSVVRVAVQLPPADSTICLLARVASSACGKAGTFDAAALAQALSAVAWAVRSCRAVDSKGAARDGRGLGSGLRDAIHSSIAVLADAMHSAIFPPMSLLRRESRHGGGGDSESSWRSGSSQLSSSGVSGSDTNWRARGGAAPPMSHSTPRFLRLRETAMDALTSIAEACPLAVVPFWALFLPEHGGVSDMQSSGDSRGIEHSQGETLANIFLFEARDSLRASAVAVTIALLSGSWHFVRGPGRVRPGKARPAAVARSSGSGSAFTSTASRATKIVTVLYTVTASAIRNEASPGVLARLMRLATELCSNAPTPAVPLSRVTCVVDALLFRLSTLSALDRTSSSAAFSCLASALTLNATAYAEDSSEALFSRILSLAVETLQNPRQPTAECLAVLQGAASCKIQLFMRLWSPTVSPLLQSIYNSAADERDVRLHALRCVHCVVSQAASSGGEEGKTGMFSAEDLESLWLSLSFVTVAMSDSFPSVRSCALQCAESFLAVSGVARCASRTGEAGAITRAVCASLAHDSSTSVRVCAIKVLSMAVSANVHPHEAILSYCCLVDGLENDTSLTVRSKSLLACSNLILDLCWPSLAIGMIKHDEQKFFALFTRHCDSALSIAGESTGVLAVGDLGERSRNELDVLQASSVSSLGTCALFCIQYDESHGNPCDASLTERAASFVDLLLTTIGRPAGSSKLRCKAGEALGRLLHVLDSKCMGSTVRALCTVLDEESRRVEDLKVKLAGVKALLFYFERREVESNKQADSGTADSFTLSILSASVRMTSFIVSESDSVAHGGGKLEHLLQEGRAHLVCEALRYVPSNVTAEAAAVTRGMCAHLAQAVWLHIGLPDFARRFLEKQTTDEEDSDAAIAAWKSLSQRKRVSVTRAASVALLCDCGGDAHAWLAAAARIAVAGSR